MAGYKCFKALRKSEVDGSLFSVTGVGPYVEYKVGEFVSCENVVDKSIHGVEKLNNSLLFAFTDLDECKSFALKNDADVIYSAIGIGKHDVIPIVNPTQAYWDLVQECLSKKKKLPREAQYLSLFYSSYGFKQIKLIEKVSDVR